MEIFWKSTISAEFRVIRFYENCIFPQNFHARNRDILRSVSNIRNTRTTPIDFLPVFMSALRSKSKAKARTYVATNTKLIHLNVTHKIPFLKTFEIFQEKIRDAGDFCCKLWMSSFTKNVTASWNFSWKFYWNLIETCHGRI